MARPSTPVNRWLPSLGLLAACAGNHCAPGSPAPATPAASVEAAVERALPAVVVLVADRSGGGSTYGSGVVVDAEGHVLTSYHVVGDDPAPRVLLHSPERVAWSPLDGGLERLLFEAESDLVRGRVVRSDPLLDLALVHVPQAVGRAPLAVRGSPPRQGEPVLALGHPQEAVWSFTSGVVSALRPGMIQHDAPINPGNSGGPLVDLQGRLLGVNTLKMLGGAEGLGFARPAELARTLLDADHRPLRADRSTPTLAAETCERILDLSPEQSAPCVRWEDGRELTLVAAERAADWLHLDPDRRSRLRESIMAVPPEVHAEAWRGVVVAHWHGRAPPGHPMLLGLPELWDDAAARASHAAQYDLLADLERRTEAHRAQRLGRSERLFHENNLHEDIGQDGLAYARTRKRGRRVEAVHPIDDRAVWIVGAGRNADGTTWRSSTCWLADEEGGWRRALGCDLLHDAPRPVSIPPSVQPTEEMVQSGALRIARYLLEEPISPG